MTRQRHVFTGVAYHYSYNTMYYKIFKNESKFEQILYLFIFIYVYFQVAYKLEFEVYYDKRSTRKVLC